MRRITLRLRALAAVALLAATTACSPTYVMRAAWEEARILSRRTPIDRLVASETTPPAERDKLITNPDGSVDLYFQVESPGQDKEANWLPAPNGPIYLVMRLYWPRTANFSISPGGMGRSERSTFTFSLRTASGSRLDGGSIATRQSSCRRWLCSMSLAAPYSS